MYSKCGKLLGILSALLMGLYCAMPVWAQEAAATATQGAPEPAPAGGMSVSSMLALSMALAAVGGSIAQSLVASKAVEGIARNPEAEGKIRSNLMLALAFIESLSIYVLVLAFMLK